MNQNQEKYQKLANQLLDRIEKMTPEDFEQKQVYSEKLSQYLEMYGRSLEEDYNEIVPVDFEISDDTATKIKVLEDCIKNHKGIEQSPFYLDLIEGEKLPEEVPPTKQV